MKAHAFAHQVLHVEKIHGQHDSHHPWDYRGWALLTQINPCHCSEKEPQSREIRGAICTPDDTMGSEEYTEYGPSSSSRIT